MHIALSALTLCALLAATGASAQAPAPAPLLTPSSPWQVDYAENECRLVREFGRDDQRVALRIARASSLEQFDVVVAGPGVPDLPLRRVTRIRLQPQGTEIESEGYSMQVPDQNFHFIRLFDMDAPVLSQFQPIQMLTVTNGSFSVSLRLDNAVQALAALQTCQDDLLTEWGFDVAQYRALERPPKSSSNEAYWVTSDDYPTDALRREQQGMTTTMLTVGIDGRVSHCRVVRSSDVASLDAAACTALMRRANFEPARGPGGQAIEAPFIKRVRWQLPIF